MMVIMMIDDVDDGDDGDDNDDDVIWLQSISFAVWKFNLVLARKSPADLNYDEVGGVVLMVTVYDDHWWSWWWWYCSTGGEDIWWRWCWGCNSVPSWSSLNETTTTTYTKGEEGIFYNSNEMDASTQYSASKLLILLKIFGQYQWWRQRWWWSGWRWFAC